MKPSRRNRDRAPKPEKRGPPPLSKYAKKTRPPPEETALGAALKSAGVVKEKTDG